MNGRALPALALVAGAVGCVVASPLLAPREVVIGAAPIVSATGLAAPLPPTATGRGCDAIVRAIDRDVEDLAKAAALPTPKRRGMVGACVEGPSGAWFVALAARAHQDLPQDEDALSYLLDSAWEVHFEPASGPGAKREIAEQLAQYGGRLVHPPRTFDFDGDGIPEIYLAVDEEGDEGHEARQHALLTFRDGKVVPYPAATAPFFDVIDQDGDGRPDLVSYAGYTESLEGCYSGFPTDHARPKFVAHGLADGTFSSLDAVAKAHAARFCPGRPAKIASSYDALCARLYASSPAEVKRERARVVASCTGKYCEREEAGRAQPKNASLDCERRLAWFDKAPPFTLP